MKRFLIGLALASALPMAPVLAQYSVNFREADVRAFIEDAARVTGRTFIVDPAVQGKVSVVTQRALSRSEYFELFLSTLRSSGLVAVPISGGAFRIQPTAGAASTSMRVASRGSANNFVTEIIRLRNIEGPQALESLRPLVSRDGSITATANSVIVADFADNVARVRQVVASIDRDSSTTRIVTLQNAGARDIAASLSQLMEGAGGRPATVVPVDSSNSLALRGDAATVARLAQLATELDQRAANGTEIRVVFLQHADAAQILPVIQQLLGQPVTAAAPNQGLSQRVSTSQNGGQSGGTTRQPINTAEPASGGGGGASGPTGSTGVFGPRSAVVTRFEGANAIVIAAPRDVQRSLGEVVRQLDTRREQVLVEAIIVEISDNAAKRLGVQLLMAGLEGSNIPFAVTNYSNAAPNILTVAGAAAAERLRRDTTTVNGQVVTTNRTSPVADALQEAAVSSVLGATGGIAGLAIRSGNEIFGAIINAVKSDTKSNILSTPSVMTLDNQEARILVGQEIPVTTGEALSNNFDNAFRTVQRQNVGISLQVKPQINAGGAIKLALRQEVSSIAGPVARGSADLILNKREIETTITVDDGEIVGIGGLLDENDRRTIEAIPFLGDLPVIGNLFRSKSRSRDKTNLMVFIRPTVLRSTADARAMTDRRYGYIRERQYQQDPYQEPSIDELVREYMGAVPPFAPPAPPTPHDPAVYDRTLVPGQMVVTPAGIVPVGTPPPVPKKRKRR
ncbi:MAG TPA: type II secretion system secretin GspD [Allosphingosinicella sp.]|nr:type II secretion system secretin GspD [Allosphingosinicella sp.]